MKRSGVYAAAESWAAPRAWGYFRGTDEGSSPLFVIIENIKFIRTIIQSTLIMDSEKIKENSRTKQKNSDNFLNSGTGNV